MNNKISPTAGNEKHRSTGSRIRRACTAVAAAVALSVPVAAITASPAQAAGSWEYWQLDNDYCYDAVARDTDYNGRYNEVWFDLDNDCYWDTHTWDGNDTHPALDHTHYDMNENNRYDIWIDFNRVGIYGAYDDIYYDTNQDGYWDLHEQRGFAVLGAPTYDGLGNLMNKMASFYGTVAY